MYCRQTRETESTLFYVHLGTLVPLDTTGSSALAYTIKYTNFVYNVAREEDQYGGIGVRGYRSPIQKLFPHTSIHPYTLTVFPLLSPPESL